MESQEDYNQTNTYSDYEYSNISSNWSEPCPEHNNNNIELVISFIICILGFIGNSLVIVTYACYKRTKSMTDVYLLNVAIADLLFVVLLPLTVHNELTSWPMGPVACKLLRGSYSVNLYSCMLLLACISTDRYIAIVQARRSFRLRSLQYSRIISSIVWVSAILLSIPTFMFYEWYKPTHTEIIFVDQEDPEEESPEEESQYVCEFKFGDSTTAQTTRVAIPSIQLAIGFFLPMLIMVFCYSAVIITLMKAKNFQRHKAVRVVLVVVVVFIICHLPYNITLLYDTVNMFHEQSCESVYTLLQTQTVTKTIAYMHCCLNPVLYAFVGVKFRNHLKKIFQDLWCLGKRYIAPRRFSRTTSEMFVSTRRSMDGSSENGSSFTM
ncbi:C-C chemokine receptor type 6a [Xyrichtys novacula]|nr:C-C chemokine receptor type 6a [Xyrichtys novacula]